MRVIRIDFVRSRAPTWAGGLLLVAAAMIAALLVIDFVRVQRITGDLETVLARLERRAAADQRKQGAVQTDAQSASALIQLAKARVEKLSMPWDRFFRMIDDMRHPDIALLSVEPDADGGIVRVGAEARDVPSMLGYISELREQGVLADAVVVNHQILQQAQYKPVRFSFVGQWKDRQ